MIHREIWRPKPTCCFLDLCYLIYDFQQQDWQIGHIGNGPRVAPRACCKLIVTGNYLLRALPRVISFSANQGQK
jgi:hypothetical protein